MRTVLVHLRDTPEADVAEYLIRAYPSRPGPPWICVAAGDPVLTIDFYRSLDVEFTPEQRDALRQALGQDPATSLAADVSGRHPGDDEVRLFVVDLLTEFAGVAQDEYTDHCWTAEQIEIGYRVQGHPFFDYRGWHAAMQ